MTSFIDATYEDGFLKPLKPIQLPQHLHVVIAINIADDDLPSMLINRLAEQSATTHFLADPRENIYSLDDGNPC